MEINVNLVVFLVVLGARLLVPLTIPRFPLPGVIASLILDGIDQTIFQRYTTLNLDGYQGYDKALDIYYLVIAYIATLRNWENPAAFEAGRFLIYFRLVGVLLFQFTHLRALLLLFPNTFEYFFIFYEAVRLRWNPARMATTVVIGATAAIWIVIKLPQEYWIHIAQRDVTDTLAANPVLIPILAVAIALLLAGAWWVITRRLPPADRAPSLQVDAPIDDDSLLLKRIELSSRRLLNWALAEKVILVSLVTVIFSQILPDVSATPLQLSLGVGFLIVTNSAVSEWLLRRGVSWSTAAKEFVAIGLINIGVVMVARWILPQRDGSIHVGNALFFLLLITLLVTLYDRYSPYHLAREAAKQTGGTLDPRGEVAPAR